MTRCSSSATATARQRRQAGRRFAQRRPRGRRRSGPGQLPHDRRPGNAIAYYSSQGPTNDGRIKPDMSAPAGMHSVMYGDTFSGTSAASPVAAGAGALILSAGSPLRAPGWRAMVKHFTIDLGAARPRQRVRFRQGAAPCAPPTAATSATPGKYVPLALPVRLLDTRPANTCRSGPRSPGPSQADGHRLRRARRDRRARHGCRRRGHQPHVHQHRAPGLPAGVPVPARRERCHQHPQHLHRRQSRDPTSRSCRSGRTARSACTSRPAATSSSTCSATTSTDRPVDRRPLRPTAPSPSDGWTPAAAGRRCRRSVRRHRREPRRQRDRRRGAAPSAIAAPRRPAYALVVNITAANAPGRRLPAGRSPAASRRAPRTATSTSSRAATRPTPPSSRSAAATASACSPHDHPHHRRRRRLHHRRPAPADTLGAVRAHLPGRAHTTPGRPPTRSPAEPHVHTRGTVGAEAGGAPERRAVSANLTVVNPPVTGSSRCYPDPEPAHQQPQLRAAARPRPTRAWLALNGSGSRHARHEPLRTCHHRHQRLLHRTSR